MTVSARPEVLVLYNPVVDTTPPDHVGSGASPTLVIHGTADTVVPPACSERFVAALSAAGNRARLEKLADARHAFIVPGYSDKATLTRALDLTVEFLREQKILPKPSHAP